MFGKSMMAGAVLLAALALPATAQSWKPIGVDPAAYSLQIISDLETRGAEHIVKSLADSMGLSENSTAVLISQFKPFEKAKAKTSGIVVDRSFNDLIRTIIVYTYGINTSTPFIYFQFTYKMTDKGWMISNMNFKSEVQAAFPAEMLNYIR